MPSFSSPVQRRRFMPYFMVGLVRVQSSRLGRAGWKWRGSWRGFGTRFGPGCGRGKWREQFGHAVADAVVEGGDKIDEGWRKLGQADAAHDVVQPREQFGIVEVVVQEPFGGEAGDEG